MPGQELPGVMYIVKLLRMLGNKILIVLVLRCFLDCANKTVPGGSRKNCMVSVIKSGCVSYFVVSKLKHCMEHNFIQSIVLS